jgi:threonine/homoserine/homoserine lactone efflux protein
VFLVVRAPRGEDDIVEILFSGLPELASPFVRGLALGLAVAAPVGPMSLLCMRQTLARGFLAGLAAGLGIATADGVYGAVAAFGLVAVTDVLVGQQPWLRVVGGLAMLWLGIGALRTRPAEAATTAEEGGGLGRAYLGTFALTMMNPSTILSFAALFAGLGLGGAAREAGAGGFVVPLALVLGVFLGSAGWWLAVTRGVSLARTRLDRRAQRLINATAGLVLIGFGLAAMASLAT